MKIIFLGYTKKENVMFDIIGLPNMDVKPHVMLIIVIRQAMQLQSGIQKIGKLQTKIIYWLSHSTEI